MNKKKEEPEQNNDIINEYMSIIDDTILNTSSNKNMEQCPVCSGVLILKNIDSKLLCEECGFTQIIIINSEKYLKNTIIDTMNTPNSIMGYPPFGFVLPIFVLF